MTILVPFTTTTYVDQTIELQDTVIAPLECSAVLTHHWLVRERGGEKVLRALRSLVPDAEVYTLLHDPTHLNDDWPTVHTSWLQRLPGARRHYPKLLPILPSAARSVRLPPVDLVLCSDAAIAKAMQAANSSAVVCYCHSPMRYIWDLSDTYAHTLPAAARPLWRWLCRRLQSADRRAADRVDQFVANSRHVADRIRRHYDREAVVVYPPVELPDAPAVGAREDFFLCVGYHVSYKRLDLAVEACRRLNRRLVVVGEGPDLARLDLARADHVQLVGWRSASEIADYYRRARALLFPGEEDFGIVPVEAIAHGCPVAAYAVGGATETVTPDVTGVWFDEQTPDALVDAIGRLEAQSFDSAAMLADAMRFSTERFLREMRAVCVRVLESGTSGSRGH